MLSSAHLDKEFWAAAINHAAFLRNLSPTSAVVDAIIPFTAVHGADFDISRLRTFGCSAFVHVERGQRKKFDPKARRGISIGHCLRNNCHLVFMPDTGKVIESIHVYEVYCCLLPLTGLDNDYLELRSTTYLKYSEPV